MDRSKVDEFNVELFRPVTGREIADAVEKIAGPENYLKRTTKVTLSGHFYCIGRYPKNSTTVMLVAVNEPPRVDIMLTSRYTEVSIVLPEATSSPQQRVKEDLIESMRSFRDALQEALKVTS